MKKIITTGAVLMIAAALLGDLTGLDKTAMVLGGIGFMACLTAPLIEELDF